MLVWVNLHAGFALGIALVLLFLLGDALDAWMIAEKRDGHPGRVRKLGPVFAACVAVVPINPYGMRMYWYPFQTLHSRAMQTYISEWFSPNFHQGMYLPALLLLLTIFIAIAGSPLRLGTRPLLLLSVMTWAALHSARLVPIYALVAAPILSHLLRPWLQERGWKAQDAVAPPKPGVRWLNAFVLAAVLVFCVARIRNVSRAQYDTEQHFFPVSAVSFLQGHILPGRIFNSYDWGGYLIWRLYPKYRVFIDGRADLYGDAFLDQFAGTYQLSDPGWQETLNHWQIQTVVVPVDAPLGSALGLAPRWKQVYRDSQSVVFRKMEPQ